MSYMIFLTTLFTISHDLFACILHWANAVSSMPPPFHLFCKLQEPRAVSRTEGENLNRSLLHSLFTSLSVSDECLSCPLIMKARWYTKTDCVWLWRKIVLLFSETVLSLSLLQYTFCAPHNLGLSERKCRCANITYVTLQARLSYVGVCPSWRAKVCFVLFISI